MGGYNEIKYWIDNYGQAGIPDKRAVEDYVICETDEKIRAFRTQLYAVSKGEFEEETLDAIVGKGRAKRHGGYADWARLMVLWLQEVKR